MSHVSRRVPALLVASIGVGVLLAGLAASHVAAQTPRVPDGMRATIDAEADEARARRSRPQAPPKPRDTTPIGQIPRFGTPPAAGAGKTGFVSILTPRRKSTAGKDPLKRAGQPKDTPLPL